MASRTGNMVLDALLAMNPGARAFDRALNNAERNMGPVTLMGGESAAQVNPQALYIPSCRASCLIRKSMRTRSAARPPS